MPVTEITLIFTEWNKTLKNMLQFATVHIGGMI